MDVTELIKVWIFLLFVLVKGWQFSRC